MSATFLPWAAVFASAGSGFFLAFSVAGASHAACPCADATYAPNTVMPSPTTIHTLVSRIAMSLLLSPAIRSCCRTIAARDMVHNRSHLYHPACWTVKPNPAFALSDSCAIVPTHGRREPARGRRHRRGSGRALRRARTRRRRLSCAPPQSRHQARGTRRVRHLPRQVQDEG